MRKTRTIVAVTLLATALCADRAAAVAVSRVGREATVPSGSHRDRNPTQQSFAQRLTRSLGQVVAAVKLHEARQDALCPVEIRGACQHAQATGRGVEGTPFQFRLPPPTR